MEMEEDSRQRLEDGWAKFTSKKQKMQKFQAEESDDSIMIIGDNSNE